jgi:hypothetical protein
MYLGLFLAPWMLLYAASAIVMNHRDFFDAPYRGKPQWIKETEKLYSGPFPPGIDPKVTAEQILASLDLEGAFNVQQNKENKVLTIHQNDLISPRRITYDPQNKKLLIERHKFRLSLLLRRLHHRRGYQQNHLPDDFWALSVDLVIFSMFFWVFSGLLLWWKIIPARRLGWLSVLGGIILFVFFILAI